MILPSGEVLPLFPTGHSPPSSPCSARGVVYSPRKPLRPELVSARGTGKSWASSRSLGRVRDSLTGRDAHPHWRWTNPTTMTPPLLRAVSHSSSSPRVERRGTREGTSMPSSSLPHPTTTTSTSSFSFSSPFLRRTSSFSPNRRESRRRQHNGVPTSSSLARDGGGSPSSLSFRKTAAEGREKMKYEEEEGVGHRGTHHGELSEDPLVAHARMLLRSSFSRPRRKPQQEEEDEEDEEEEAYERHERSKDRHARGRGSARRGKKWDQPRVRSAASSTTSSAERSSCSLSASSSPLPTAAFLSRSCPKAHRQGLPFPSTSSAASPPSLEMLYRAMKRSGREEGDTRFVTFQKRSPSIEKFTRGQERRKRKPSEGDPPHKDPLSSHRQAHSLPPRHHNSSSRKRKEDVEEKKHERVQRITKENENEKDDERRGSRKPKPSPEHQVSSDVEVERAKRKGRGGEVERQEVACKASSIPKTVTPPHHESRKKTKKNKKEEVKEKERPHPKGNPTRSSSSSPISFRLSSYETPSPSWSPSTDLTWRRSARKKKVLHRDSSRSSTIRNGITRGRRQHSTSFHRYSRRRSHANAHHQSTRPRCNDKGEKRGGRSRDREDPEDEGEEEHETRRSRGEEDVDKISASRCKILTELGVIVPSKADHGAPRRKVEISTSMGQNEKKKNTEEDSSPPPHQSHPNPKKKTRSGREEEGDDKTEWIHEVLSQIIRHELALAMERKEPEEKMGTTSTASPQSCCTSSPRSCCCSVSRIPSSSSSSTSSAPHVEVRHDLQQQPSLARHLPQTPTINPEALLQHTNLLREGFVELCRTVKQELSRVEGTAVKAAVEAAVEAAKRWSGPLRRNETGEGERCGGGGQGGGVGSIPSPLTPVGSRRYRTSPQRRRPRTTGLPTTTTITTSRYHQKPYSPLHSTTSSTSIERAGRWGGRPHASSPPLPPRPLPSSSSSSSLEMVPPLPSRDRPVDARRPMSIPSSTSTFSTRTTIPTSRTPSRREARGKRARRPARCLRRRTSRNGGDNNDRDLHPPPHRHGVDEEEDEEGGERQTKRNERAVSLPSPISPIAYAAMDRDGGGGGGLGSSTSSSFSLRLRECRRKVDELQRRNSSLQTPSVVLSNHRRKKGTTQEEEKEKPDSISCSFLLPSVPSGGDPRKEETGTPTASKERLRGGGGGNGELARSLQPPPRPPLSKTCRMLWDSTGTSPKTSSPPRCGVVPPPPHQDQRCFLFTLASTRGE